MIQSELLRNQQNLRIKSLRVNKKTSAIITKQALIYAYQTLKPYGEKAKLVNVVHDEIVIEAKEQLCEEIAYKIQQDMIKAGSIYCSTVPMVVEPQVSINWIKK